MLMCLVASLLNRLQEYVGHQTARQKAPAAVSLLLPLIHGKPLFLAVTKVAQDGLV